MEALTWAEELTGSVLVTVEAEFGFGSGLDALMFGEVQAQAVLAADFAAALRARVAFSHISKHSDR